MSFFPCPKCKKGFSRKFNLDTHLNKKFDCSLQISKNYINNLSDNHIDNKIEVQYDEKMEKMENDKNNVKNNINEFCCEFCSRKYSTNGNLRKHLRVSCKIKKEKDEEKAIREDNIKFKNEIITKITKFEKENQDLKNKIISIIANTKANKQNVELGKINKNIKKLEETIPVKQTQLINNHLISTIIEKDKTIKELGKIVDFEKELDADLALLKKKDSSTNVVNITNNNNAVISEQNPMILTVGNISISCREDDKYINATQLCDVGNKKISDWLKLASTNKYLEELENKTKISKELLIDKKIGGIHEGTWVYPQIAIQISLWINFDNGVIEKIFNWIFGLFIGDNFVVYTQNIKDKDKHIRECESRIKLLEKMVLKRQKRTTCPKSNVVYIVTCKELKEERKFIIGKSVNMTNRLSSYDKMSEYEIVYTKAFETEREMKLAESIVLEKLTEYRDKVNKDRFILPIGSSIKLFIDVIDKAYNCFY
jgi:hypothetical protein